MWSTWRFVDTDSRPMLQLFWRFNLCLKLTKCRPFNSGLLINVLVYIIKISLKNIEHLICEQRDLECIFVYMWWRRIRRRRPIWRYQLLIKIKLPFKLKFTLPKRKPPRFTPERSIHFLCLIIITFIEIKSDSVLKFKIN